MNKLLTVLLALVIFAVPAFADDDKKNKTESQSAKLIKQLGADDYDTREAATNKLYELAKKDKRVLSALVDAYAKSKDPEVKNRIGFIVGKLASPPKTKKKNTFKKPVAPPNNGIPKIEIPDQLKDVFDAFGGENDLFKKMMDALGGDKDVDITKLIEEFIKQFAEDAPDSKPAPDTKKPIKTLKKRFNRIGVKGRSLPDSLRSHVKAVPENQGVIIVAVKKDSLAYKLGLKQDDIITDINGTKIRKPSDLVTYRIDADGKTEVTLVRGGKLVKAVYKTNTKPKKDGDF